MGHPVKLDVFNACNLINCFSSHREEHPKFLKCGLEVHYSEQKEKLNEFYTIISNLKVVGKQSLMPWQHGVLTSITAILAIFELLKETKGIRYILTSRFNQVLNNKISTFPIKQHFQASKEIITTFQ